MIGKGSLKLSFVIFSFGILLMFMYELVYSVIRIIYTYVSRKKETDSTSDISLTSSNV